MPTAANSIRVVGNGFSLVEMIITIIIIAITTVAISSSLAFALGHQSDGIWRAKAVSLAEAYLEEIAARRFDENTPIGGVPACSPSTNACSLASNFDDGETRANYDDVDDYHGVNELPPLDADGQVRSGYSNYRVAVQVNYANAGQMAALGLPNSTDAKIITVTVTPPGQQPMDFTLLRSNF